LPGHGQEPTVYWTVKYRQREMLARPVLTCLSAAMLA
jgi:hypothetical protein